MANYSKKAQHLWRCSTHNIHKPRVACTIVWQPWAIKNATPMVLKHVFRNTNSVVSCGKKRQIMHLFTPNHFTLYYQQHHHLQLTLKQLAPFPWLTTPLPLRGTIGYCSWSLRNEECKGLGVRLCMHYTISPFIINHATPTLVSSRNSTRVVPMIAQGWRAKVLSTLGYNQLKSDR